MGVQAQTVTLSTVQQCDAALAQLSQRRAPDGFDRACRSVMFPSEIFQPRPQQQSTPPSTPPANTGTTPPSTGTTRPPVATTTTAPPTTSTGVRNPGVIYRQTPGIATATQPTGPVVN